MARQNTLSGLAADIGIASSYKDQYYYGTDTGVYYYSDGTNWTVTTFDGAGSVINRSSSIVAGNTAQVVMHANPARKWLYFQNLSNADMHIGIGYVPTTSNGIFITKDGGSLRFDTFVPAEAIHVLCASSTKAYVALEG